MRDGFRALASGWLLDDLGRSVDRIEALARWERDHPPLTPAEAAVVRLMLAAQAAMAFEEHLAA